MRLPRRKWASTRLMRRSRPSTASTPCASICVQDVRIHGIIKKGGEAVDVVPALAEVEFAARALDTPTMLDAYGKVITAAKAAAMAAGATLEYKPPRTELLSPVMVPEYLDLVRKNIQQAGVPNNEVIRDAARSVLPISVTSAMPIRQSISCSRWHRRRWLCMRMPC